MSGGRVVCAYFNESFRAVNDSRARYRILLGSAGSGKSVNVAQDYIVRLCDPVYEGANLLVVRRSEQSNRDSTYAELLGAARRVYGADADRFWRATAEPLALESRVTGNRIIFRGMLDDRQRERVKSVSFPRGKLCFIWCEEATELREADADILDDRLRGDLTSLNPALYYQMTLTFNPVDARHWIKRRYFDAPPDENVLTHKSVYTENAFIDPAYRARMARRARDDPDGYRVYGLAEWGGRGSAIISHAKTVHAEQSLAAYDFACIGQDFGFNHADVLLLVGFRDGAVTVLRELVSTGADTGEIIRRAEAAGFPRELPMYCDSAEPDRIKTWRAAGWRAVPVKKEPGSVAAQIDWLRSHPLYIDAGCARLLAELAGWQWLPDSVSGEPTDTPSPGFDDAIAALRYSIEAVRRPRAHTLDKGLIGA